MVNLPPKAVIRALALGFFLSVGFPPGAAQAVCGDGIFDAGETCDDLNVAAGDGCDAACAIEAGFACVGEPSECGTLLSLDLVNGSGDSLVTRDELTDLEWLDVSETLGLSFDAVQSGPSGPLANGWRPAESAEVCSLLGRYALAPAICPEPSEAVSPADIASFVHTLLGRTDGGTPADPALDASFDDALTGSDGVFRGRALLELRNAGTSTAALISDDQVDPLVASPIASHLLVRVAGPCGDLDLNGAVELADADALRTHLADPAGSLFGATEFDRCTVIGAQRPCDSRDVAALLRALDPSVSERTLEQNCAAAIGATTCGDASIEPGETCDDGAALGGDGCGEFCEIESGFECAGEPSSCNLICSNGVLNGFETCDDANLTPGDGCGADCQTEAGFSCSGEPSTCSFVCGDGIIDPNEPCDDGNLNSGDGCSNLCSLEAGFNCSGEPSVCAENCGDGLVVGIETCDDGATSAGDGCDASCQVEAGFSCSGAPSSCVTTCGDSVIAGIEQCDDGNQSSFDGCSGTCSVEPGTTCTGQPSNCVFTCGDGALSGSEECDDANLAPGDGCSATCRIEAGFNCSGEPSTCTPFMCGDGLIQGTETCDDGNTADSDGCSAVCAIENGFSCSGEPSTCATTCGDGVIAGSEICDDGNAAPGDGCSDICAIEAGFVCSGEPSSCTAITCGDGLVQGTETCDDGNTADSDGCSAVCAIENGFSCSGEPSTCATTCGDGVIAGSEICDDGNAAPGDGCSDICAIEAGFVCSGEPSSCTAITCGDGLIQGAETCDDGNTADSDGCSAVCAIENGFSCTGEPSTCTTTCGDGLVAGTETCDDGNTAAADGCSDVCAVESGFDCTGEPSTCTTTCGDGLVAGTETCDDGNAAAADGCSDVCAIESGFNCSGEPSTCTTTCGDGLIAGAETCDDGNSAPADGCDDSCLIETGFVCNGEPSSCNTVCGDGIPAGLEACDDGNLIALDGCDDLCAVEADYMCYGAPSVCLNVSHSLAVNDAAVIAAGDFSFSRTVQAIIDSSGGSATTAVDFVQTFIDTFNETSHTQPESGLEMPVDLRPGEAALDPNDLLDPATDDGLVPVALFNRFDLAPADGSHCGEHRIIYARQGPGVGFPRLTLIFEAALPNPTPVLGLEGCRPIAEFWASLSDQTAFPTAASRASALENFYYTGLPGFDAVVTHAAYGVPLGQVRADIFMTGEWQLREFRTFFATGGEAILVAGTIASTPLVQYYDSNFDVTTAAGFAGVTDEVLFGTERSDFQTDFLDNRVSELLGQELGAAPITAFDLINRSSVSIPSRFWEFQVDSQPQFSDSPELEASADLRSAIDAKLTTLGVTQLTSEHVLNRVGAMTCGGCHQFSVGQVIGKTDAGIDILWPNSNQFTHVNELGHLSDALTNFFLPFRRNAMGEFLSTPSGGSNAAPAALRLPLARTKLMATRAQRDFEQVLDSFYKCEDADDMPEILEALDRTIDKVRWEDSVKPGAFYDVRRTH